MAFDQQTFLIQLVGQSIDLKMLRLMIDFLEIWSWNCRLYYDRIIGQDRQLTIIIADCTSHRKIEV